MPAVEPTLIEEALDAIDGLRALVEAEAIAHGLYHRPNQRDADSICGGANVCALGGLWVAAGITPTNLTESDSAWIYTLIEGRTETLASHPALALALDALNTQADFFAERIEQAGDVIVRYSALDDDASQDDALEEVFEARIYPAEGGAYRQLGRGELLEVIDAARGALAARLPCEAEPLDGVDALAADLLRHRRGLEWADATPTLRDLYRRRATGESQPQRLLEGSVA